LNSTALLFGMVLPWLLLGFGSWLGFQLIRQNGRILLRLEGLEQGLSRLRSGREAGEEELAGLPVGTEAPEFQLPNLQGGRTALSEFRGRRVLVLFFNPRCGFCTELLPDLADLTTDAAEGRPVLLVVTTGDPDENRRLFQEHRLYCPVLLQEEMEVAARYHVQGTPTGYLIDEHGQIAGEMAVGALAVLALGNQTNPSTNGHNPEAAHGNGHARLPGIRSVTESKIERNGLPAGAPAPSFTLPRVDGGELSLESYRGRWVLLVFSDPECGPCDMLAPRLEQVSRRASELQVLMVSRRDLEANRRKVAEHGLTFPVVLQRQWEISRRYGMFSTPVGYLIDPEGVIAADVAVGGESILALLSGASAVIQGKEAMPLRA
jgi:peroxiredoxin